MQSSIVDLKLEFIHHGIRRTLVKHPAVRLALRRGELKPDEAQFKRWYLRLKLADKERVFKLAWSDKDAIRQAKDILNGRIDRPSDFTLWLADRDARHGITLGRLAEEWISLKCPSDDGRPRTEGARIKMEDQLQIALEWWAHRPAEAVNRGHLLAYATWRRAEVQKRRPRHTGDRAVDLALGTLSCLCEWAVAADKIKTNPFTDRPRFRRSEDVQHCHEVMPPSDEVMHRLLTWFWTPSNHDEPEISAVVGASLCWCSLTGLRTGEPLHLRRAAALLSPPPDPKSLVPGTVFPTRDGKRKMKIRRLKRGQNPYLTLHDLALQFLDIWAHWLDSHLSAAELWFPHPRDGARAICRSSDTSLLNDLLRRACETCKVAPCSPYGFGRAYYVRVRRSQGAEDATIASELGQTTQGKLVRDTYGDPDDMVGGALFDWLPESDDGKLALPAWQLLAKDAAPSNIISL